MAARRGVYLILTVDEARAIKLALDLTYTPSWPDEAGLRASAKTQRAIALAEDTRPVLHGPRYKKP